MSFLWEGVKQMSQLAGAAALLAGQKTKIRGEMMLTEREVKTRQQIFGVELYDYVAPLAKSPDFFAANDKMTDTIRGPFLAAQREIAALMIKRSKLKEELAQAEVTRKAAFPQPATTFGEQVINTGKATAFTANEVKIKTEIGMVDAQIKAHKEEFGEGMFATFIQLEDEEGWLPTVRDIRSMYDKARQDVDKLKIKLDAKEKELNTLGTENDVAAREFSTTATTGTFPSSYSSQATGSSLATTSTTAAVAPAPVSAPLPAMPAAPPTPATAFGAFPTSYAPPAPAPATTANFGSFSDHYRPPGAAATQPTVPSTASGLFLGMGGAATGGSIASGSGHAGAYATQATTTTASPHHDPFAYQNTAPPSFAAAAAPDPFASTAPSAPQAPNDPFSFVAATPTPSHQQGLPYDPFSNTTAAAHKPYDDDPFADLVAGRGTTR